MKQRYWKISSLCLILVGLIGCGAPSESSAPQTTLNVVAQDFKYDAATWVVSRNTAVTISLQNKGTVEHEWVVVKAGTDITLPFSDDDEDKVFWEIEAEAGKTNTETWTTPTEAGTYQVVCGIPAHIEQGMKATLEVK